MLALGFLGPEESAIKALGVDQDPRTNIKTAAGKYSTSIPGVFAAGDCRRGQSLIVWGIQEGRAAAVDVDEYLQHGNESRLPFAGSITRRHLQPSKIKGHIPNGLPNGHANGLPNGDYAAPKLVDSVA